MTYENGIDADSKSGKSMFMGLNRTWVYAATCMPVPKSDLPGWAANATKVART